MSLAMLKTVDCLHFNCRFDSGNAMKPSWRSRLRNVKRLPNLKTARVLRKFEFLDK